MTIEGRPDIQHNWEKEFEQQRKDRLQDAIDEYLQDDKVSPRRAYEEILSCVQDVMDYNRKQLDRSTALKCLLMGHREIDFMGDPELASKWQYDKLPERF